MRQPDRFRQAEGAAIRDARHPLQGRGRADQPLPVGAAAGPERATRVEGVRAGEAQTRWIYAAAALAVAAADQLVKAAVVRALPPGESVSIVPGLLALTHVRNTGVAFGLAAALPVAVPAVIALTFLFLLFYNRPRWTRPPLARGAIALLAGGATGNLIDRIRLGAVIDYLDVSVWPVFNLADITLTVGAALLIVSIVLEEKTA